MRKQINGYNNYYIYDNGDVLNSSTISKVCRGLINLMVDFILNI